MSARQSPPSATAAARSATFDKPYCSSSKALLLLKRPGSANPGESPGLVSCSPRAAASYSAHVLLGALRPDLIDGLLASGDSPQAIRSAQAALARRVLD